MKGSSKKQNREPISKRLRFEVFKRDAFTCQYCGKTAPNVILEVDHIEPVSKGGKTTMLNLITSCKECNRGKSNIKLSDNSAIEKQQKALLELSEKQEQLRMLLKWRSGLLKIENEELDAVLNNWTRITGYHLTESGMSIIKKQLKDFGVRAVLEAMDIVSGYLIYKKGSVTKDSVELAFNKIKGVCYIRSLPEEKREEYKIIGGLKMLMKKKYYNYNEKWAPILINRFLKNGNSLNELEYIIKESPTYNEWEEVISTYSK
ncbi:MAG: HNH endonuclease [Syntrophomonas sp.]